MTVIKWKPTAYSPVFNDFFNGVYKNLNKTTGHEGYSVPAVNVAENGECFRLELAVPGLTKEDLNINLEKNVLTISAEKKTENQQNNEKYMRKEFSYNSFKRSFHLPEQIETDRIEAKYENGVLNIWIPKKDEAKEKPVKTIEIN